MESRERLIAAIEHRPVDRIPTDFWATTEVQESLFNHFSIESGIGDASPWIGLNGGALSRNIPSTLALFDSLGVDGMFHVQPPYIGPPKRSERGLQYNEWGFGYQSKEYAYGSYLEQVVYPLSTATTPDEIESFAWPDPDWYDYQALPDLIEQCEGCMVTVGYHALFTYHNYLRGLENSLMDPCVNPELTTILLSRLQEFFLEYHRRCFEAAPGLIDSTQVTDDWGSQTGPMVSPATFREFYSEGTRLAVMQAHRYGLKVFHHDDGDCRLLLPDLVDMGIDILNPVQYRCGNWDLPALKTLYGKRVCFHSGVDNQEVLPLGRVEDVRKEVEKLVDNLASDGTGFIVGPCHNLQPNTPIENIVALYQTAASYGY